MPTSGTFGANLRFHLSGIGERRTARARSVLDLYGPMSSEGAAAPYLRGWVAAHRKVRVKVLNNKPPALAALTFAGRTYLVCTSLRTTTATGNVKIKHPWTGK